ncbi:MAG: carboxymuconolactone decarboxylase family protein, partial [Planctomycetia bacterium]
MGESAAAHPAGLTTAQRAALGALLARAARGGVGGLAARAAACRAAGVPPGTLREALLQLVPYVGFPRTLGALQALAGAGLPSP